MFSILVAAVLAGSLVYCVMVVEAVRRYRSVRPPAFSGVTPISILKPLAGLDLGLEENLRSFFRQDYPGEFEILFAVRHASDPAVPVVEKLRAECPHVASRLLLVGEPPYPNAKVFSLDHMLRAAKFDLLVMSDSDIRVDASMLRVVAAEFSDPKVGMATCPYRAFGGPSIWSKLEAAGMDTEFWGGALVARMLEGMHFAVGPDHCRASRGAGADRRLRCAEGLPRRGLRDGRASG